MKCPFVIRQCTKCKRLLVANIMNFNKCSKVKIGLKSICRECQSKDENTRNRFNKKIKENGNPFDNIDTNKVWNHCPFCIKVCTKCGKILVANEINFLKQKKGKLGLTAECKNCRNNRSIERYYNNKDEISEKNKEHYKNNKNKILEKCRQYKECHREEVREKERKRYHKNKDKEKIRKAKYYKENKEKIYERIECYRNEHPEMEINRCAKRRLKEENQGNGISKEQWKEMMEFFDWKCAYSGIQLDKNNRSIDHIIPLSLDGEHEVWNCVPMTRSLNSSKCTNDMLEWYKKQEFYSEERLNRIYEWIEYAYNKWCK